MAQGKTVSQQIDDEAFGSENSLEVQLEQGSPRVTFRVDFGRHGPDLRAGLGRPGGSAAEFAVDGGS